VELHKSKAGDVTSLISPNQFLLSIGLWNVTTL